MSRVHGKRNVKVRLHSRHEELVQIAVLSTTLALMKPIASNVHQSEGHEHLGKEK
jgi:hypothetical protein